jgi:hypothetical protein
MKSFPAPTQLIAFTWHYGNSSACKELLPKSNRTRKTTGGCFQAIVYVSVDFKEVIEWAGKGNRMEPCAHSRTALPWASRDDVFKSRAKKLRNEKVFS